MTLTTARRLPGDREWAVLTEAGERHAQKHQTNGEPDRWLPKSCFLRGAAGSQLQAMTGGWQDKNLALHHPSGSEISFRPETDSDRLIQWLLPFWPADTSPPTRLVRGAAIWTDSATPVISILSLASLADLEARAAGQSFGTSRWRGNLWLSGLPPFAERDLIGQTIRIGQATLRVVDHIVRCEATSANTDTGMRDIDMLATLQDLYGHKEFGIFAEVIDGGEISVGDKVNP